MLATSGLCRPGAVQGTAVEPTPGWVALDDETIVEVGLGDPPVPATDLGDAWLAPGYVDLQCNGVGTADFADGETDGWRRAARVLAEHGVTSFCATLVSTSRARYDAALAVASTVLGAPSLLDSDCLGIHLEGPFLGGAPGAHDPSHVSPVDLAWVEEVLTQRPGVVRIVTLAPEADPESVLIRRLVAAGVTVALGHSTASYDESRAAVDAGATVATHLFNAMGPLHQRAPGLAGAALDDERLTPTLIADLVHVHPAMIRLAFARRPAVALVSDAVAVTDGLVARDGAAYRPDGTLAGATLLLDGAVAAAVRAGVAPTRAIEAATFVPASLVDASDRGRLEPGARADLVALHPTTLAVQRVWAAGAEVGGPRR